MLATQAMESVALLLRGLEGQEGQQGQAGLETESGKPLQTKEVAV